MSTGNDTGGGYNTFESRPPPYSDSVKNMPYQAGPASTGQYHPLPNEPLQPQHHVTVIQQQPVVVCRTMVLCDKPNNYLVVSVINLLCCCFCLGVAALVYSLRVDSEYAAGRVNEAIAASLMARKLNRIGFLLGILLYVVNVVISIALLVVNVNNDDDDDNYNDNYNY